MVIVAPVDRSTRASDVLSEAASVSEAFEEPVHVVHVLSRAAFVDLGTSRARAGDPVDMEDVREAAADIAAEAAADLDVPFEAVGLMGDPASTVVEYATDHDTRYIVVAGRKRSPAGKVLFGSTAQSILLNATCPVIMSISSPE